MMTRREALEILSALVGVRAIALVDGIYAASGGQAQPDTTAAPNTAPGEDVRRGLVLQSASRNAAMAVSIISERVSAEIRAVERQIYSYALTLGELMKSDIVLSQIHSHSDFIERFGRTAFERNMMRAIIFEEQVHEKPPFIEFPLERLGFGDTLGLGQFSESRWAERYMTDRAGFLDSETNIRIMSIHFTRILDELDRRRIPGGPEWIGTLWNNFGANVVSDYGRRVGTYYRRFASAAAVPVVEPARPTPAAEPAPPTVPIMPPSQPEPTPRARDIDSRSALSPGVSSPASGWRWESTNLLGDRFPWETPVPSGFPDWSSPLNQSSLLEPLTRQTPAIDGVSAVEQSQKAESDIKEVGPASASRGELPEGGGGGAQDAEESDVSEDEPAVSAGTESDPTGAAGADNEGATVIIP